jgi:hypothetical protein
MYFDHCSSSLFGMHSILDYGRETETDQSNNWHASKASFAPATLNDIFGAIPLNVGVFCERPFCPHLVGLSEPGW